MTRIKAKNILLVAPGVISSQLLDARGEEVRHVTKASEVFPALFSKIPDLVILDNDLLGAELERIVRRIRTNPFYKRIKICCYKQKASPNTDNLLATIGVNYFLYAQNSEKYETHFSLPKSISNLFEAAALNVAVQ